MLPRNLLLPVAFAAAIGIPLIAFQAKQDSTGNNPAITANDTSGLPGGESDLFAGAEMYSQPIGSLGEILRFDIYPNWVKSRWARVSTAPASDGLQGMRVALVTGPNPWDICGSLTYYFDENMKVQRIALIGDTGDASQLAKFLVEQFQFKVHQSRAAGLMTASKYRRVIGVLKLENPTVIHAADPNHQVRVYLELNNPDGSLEVSETMVSLVQASPY